jgi:hypothetical protein
MKTYVDFCSIVKSIDYKDWIFKVIEKNNLYFLVISVTNLNTKTNKSFTWNSRKWYLSPYMTDSEVVQTVFLAVKTAEEHELRENFKYKEELIFGPHINVNYLVTVSRFEPEDKRNEYIN